MGNVTDMRRSVQLMLMVSGLALGVAGGYLVVKNRDSIEHAMQRLGSAIDKPRRRAQEMSEEVALRTARLTNNPKVNQDWVSRQWDAAGF